MAGVIAKSLAGCDCVYVPQTSGGIYSVRNRIIIGIVISNVIRFDISVAGGGRMSHAGLKLANGVGVCML